MELVVIPITNGYMGFTGVMYIYIYHPYKVELYNTKKTGGPLSLHLSNLFCWGPTVRKLQQRREAFFPLPRVQVESSPVITSPDSWVVANPRKALLVGGFKYFFDVHPNLGKISHIFHMGWRWNHYPSFLVKFHGGRHRTFLDPKKSVAFWKGFHPRLFQRSVSGIWLPTPRNSPKRSNLWRDVCPVRSRSLIGQGEFSEEVWFLLQVADTFT